MVGIRRWGRSQTSFATALAGAQLVWWPSRNAGWPMSDRSRVGWIAAGYCIAGMVAATAVLINMGTLSTHVSADILISVGASIGSAWWMGWAMTPIFQKYSSKPAAAMFGTAIAFTTLFVGGIVGAIAARIADGTIQQEAIFSSLLVTGWTVFKMMVLFGWGPALLLGSVCGYHIRVSLRPRAR